MLLDFTILCVCHASLLRLTKLNVPRSVADGSGQLWRVCPLAQVHHQTLNLMNVRMLCQFGKIVHVILTFVGRRSAAGAEQRSLWR